MIERILEASAKGLVAGTLGAIVLLIIFLLKLFKKQFSKKIKNSKTIEIDGGEKTTRITKEKKIAIPENNNDSKIENEFYEQIWREIEENKTDLGLWAKCFSTCEGDENKTKALYVNQRILILKENLQNQLIEQDRKAKIKNEKEITKKLLDQERKTKKETTERLLILEGRTDNIAIFKKTLETMPTFFPNILKQFGYKLERDRNSQETWSIYFPNGIGVMHVYNLYDLRTEIIKIVAINQEKKCP